MPVSVARFGREMVSSKRTEKRGILPSAASGSFVNEAGVKLSSARASSTMTAWAKPKSVTDPVLGLKPNQDLR